MVNHRNGGHPGVLEQCQVSLQGNSHLISHKKQTLQPVVIESFHMRTKRDVAPCTMGKHSL